MRLKGGGHNGEHHASRQLSNSTWNQIKKLLPSDGTGKYDYFGFSVAVSGDMVVVGDVVMTTRVLEADPHIFLAPQREPSSFSILWTDLSILF